MSLKKELEHGYNVVDGVVYLGTVKCSYIDLPSFKVLNQYFAKDKNHAYVNFMSVNKQIEHIVEQADPASFSVVGEMYAKDKRNVYFRGTVIPQADRESFEVLTSWQQTWYAKDKNHVYQYGEVQKINQEKIETIKLGMPWPELFELLGPPLLDLGSGRYILFWEAEGSTGMKLNVSGGSYVQEISLIELNNPKQDKQSDDNKQMITFHKLPKVEDAVIVQLGLQTSMSKGLEMSVKKIKKLLTTMTALAPHDPIVTGWRFSPWLKVLFKLPDGSYSLELMQGGLGILTKPDGKKGYVMLKLKER